MPDDPGSSSRKEMLRRDACLRNHPRRDEARFTAENDHNPEVHEACPDCRGTLKRCRSVDGGEVLEACPSCGQTGVTGRLIPYFDNDAPALKVTVRGDGWLACPNCQVRFTIADPNAWTGLRHRACGQKIVLSP